MMTDCSLGTLTAEERALLDQFALREYLNASSASVAEKCYESGYGLILARRALFAPAKEECPNCGEMTSEPHLDRKSVFVGSYYSCQKPEPAEWEPDLSKLAERIFREQPAQAAQPQGVRLAEVPVADIQWTLNVAASKAVTMTAMEACQRIKKFLAELDEAEGRKP